MEAGCCSATPSAWTAEASAVCHSGLPSSTPTGRTSRSSPSRMARSTWIARCGLLIRAGSSAGSESAHRARSASAPQTAVTPSGSRRTPTARPTFRPTSHRTAPSSSSSVFAQGHRERTTAQIGSGCSLRTSTGLAFGRSRPTASHTRTTSLLPDGLPTGTRSSLRPRKATCSPSTPTATAPALFISRARASPSSRTGRRTGRRSCSAWGSTARRTSTPRTPDGSNVKQVTDTPDFENGPDWGTHPLAG
jgi:hypothetical protein